MNIDSILTPCYVINLDKFCENVRAFKKAFDKEDLIIGYSFKTNHNRALLDKARELGLFAEVVSGDEYELARNNGFLKGSIIYNGPGKPAVSVVESINAGQITNLDSLQEVNDLVAHRDKLIKNPETGLRLNFNLEKTCPGETTAGDMYTRFGISTENGDLERAVDLLHSNGIGINCLHVHYSTKTRSAGVFRALAKTAVETVIKNDLQDEIKYIDIGGGFFYGENRYSDGKPKLSEYARVIKEELCRLKKEITLVLEPGASLISTSVKYYSRVVGIKDIPEKRFCIFDGSLLHINPLMHSRQNSVQTFTLSERSNKIDKQCLCGCTCMEMDRFGELEKQDELSVGDYMECDCAGAYTMVYNSCFIACPPYVYEMSNDTIRLVRNKDGSLMKEY